MIEPYGPLVLLCTSVHLPSNGHFLQDKKEKNENDVDEDLVPYSFFLDDREITKSLEETLNADGERSVEKVTEIIYQPQAQFKLVYWSAAWFVVVSESSQTPRFLFQSTRRNKMFQFDGRTR